MIRRILSEGISADELAALKGISAEIRIKRRKEALANRKLICTLSIRDIYKMGYKKFFKKVVVGDVEYYSEDYDVLQLPDPRSGKSWIGVSEKNYFDWLNWWDDYSNIDVKLSFYTVGEVEVDDEKEWERLAKASRSNSLAFRIKYGDDRRKKDPSQKEIKL